MKHFYNKNINSTALIIIVLVSIINILTKNHFDPKLFTLVLAIGSITVLYVSFLRKDILLRIFSLLLICKTIFQIVYYDLKSLFDIGYDKGYFSEFFVQVVNIDSLLILLSTLTLFVAVYIYNRFNKQIYEYEKYVPAILVICANVILIIYVSTNVSAYAEYFILANKIRSQEYIEMIHDIKQYVYTASLVIHSVITFIVSLSKKIKYLRKFSLIVFSLSIVKLLLIDLMILNETYRVISFVVLGIVLIVLYFIYQNYKDTKACDS